MIEELAEQDSQTDLLAAITVLCLASAAIGAILQYWHDALHYAHGHRAHRAHDWWAREIRAWRKHRARHRRVP